MLQTGTRARVIEKASMLSPYGLALLSYGVFLLAWLMPATYYSEIVGEKNELFLDPTSILFFTICVAAFLAGAWVVDFFMPSDFVMPRQILPRSGAVTFLLVPLAAGIVLTIVSIYLLLAGNPLIFDLIATQQGVQLKEGMNIHQPLGLASVWLLGICWWAMWRRRQMVVGSLWKRILIGCAVTVALLVIVSSAALKLARGEFMPVAVGTLLVYLLQRRASQRFSRKTMVRFAIAGAVAVVAVFLLFSVARGSDDLLAEATVYTVASYNRLAAMVNGRLHYPYGGRGVYLSSFLSFNASFNKVIPIASIMLWPSFDDLWASEFTATWQAGLNGFVIWAGTFGYLFADFGWFAPLAVFAQGLLCGWMWRSLKLGHTLGVILYPWCGFCVLFWFGTNFLLDTKMVVLFVVAALLALYERMFTQTGLQVKQL